MTSATANVVVVGAGALGSHLVLLGRNLAASWTVVDFDKVEQRNVLAQFHSRMGLGRNKAQALQQSMQGLFGLRIKPVPHRLAADNVEALLGGADLVIDCVDNGATRRLIQGFVRGAEGGRAPIACLHGAIAQDGAYGRVMWDEVFTIDHESAEGQPTCEDGEHLPFVAFTAARMAAIVAAFLATGARRSEHLHPGGIVLVREAGVEIAGASPSPMAEKRSSSGDPPGGSGKCDRFSAIDLDPRRRCLCLRCGGR